VQGDRLADQPLDLLDARQLRRVAAQILRRPPGTLAGCAVRDLAAFRWPYRDGIPLEARSWRMRALGSVVE
jgi:hypothetical protein